MNRSPKRVLFVTPTYPDRPGGVRGTFIKDLADELVRRGIAVDVLTPRIFEDSPAVEETDGVNITRFSFRSEQKILADYSSIPVKLMLSYMRCGIRALRRALREGEYDILHGHWAIPTGLMAALGRRHRGIPLVISTHGSDLLVWGMKPGLKSLLRWTLRQAQVCTANSEPLLNLTTELGGRTVPESLIFETGVDIAQFHPALDIAEAREAAGFEGTDLHVLFVGNLIGRKGIDLALQALSQLDTSESRVKFIIVGGGKERDALGDQAERLGVASQVQFVGPLSHDQLPPYFRACDVFLLPSRSEGMGIVLLEAAASGKPAIGTSVGGIPTIIRSGETGLIVPPEDSDALALALAQLLRDKEMRLRMGQQARQLAEREYSRDAQVGKLLTVYSHALS